MKCNCWVWSSLFKKLNLDKLLKPTNQKADLAEWPLMAQYPSHCYQLCTYFVSIKKCGSSECTGYLLPQLPNKIFEHIHQLLDPTTDKSNEGHFSELEEVLGRETSESHIISIKLKPTQKSNLQYTALKQHTTNTKMTLRCPKYDKPQLVFSKKNPTTKILIKFNKLLIYYLHVEWWY